MPLPGQGSVPLCQVKPGASSGSSWGLCEASEAIPAPAGVEGCGEGHGCPGVTLST